MAPAVGVFVEDGDDPDIDDDGIDAGVNIGDYIDPIDREYSDPEIRRIVRSHPIPKEN